MGGFNEGLFHALNSLVGRSWAIDSVIALSLDNIFVKAGPIGACFFYAWYLREDSPREGMRRRILLVTLLSLFLIAPLTKHLSESRLAPRPFLLSQQTWVLHDGRLDEGRRIEARPMQTGEMLKRSDALREGRIDPNDLGSFPSDHAAFFIALSLGIFLASRRAGAIALAWTVFVTLASRIAAGMHWPVDIAAGAVIGAAVLAVLQWTFSGRWARLWDPIVGWCARYPGIAGAALFLLLLEAANTMQTLKRTLEIVSALAGRVL
ncbi:MAG TPA: phosphatase PAP2 family protein [Allosphingosinicella sp.]|nr:phosphatase PAP2 family protein [Allosphingosinicella sp.]